MACTKQTACKSNPTPAVKQGETSPAEVLGRIFTKYQELLWKQGLEHEYLRVGFSAPLFEDIEWPLMDSYLKRLH